jgi:hypothetical protein
VIHRWKKSRATYLALGLGLGLLVGLNLQGIWPHEPIHATATHGEENFAVATGYVDEENEAMFFLDFFTGELRAAVPNRQNGTFLSFFQHNISKDFEDSQAKNPKYRMVTGAADFMGGRGNTQIARSVVYIAEATSGVIAVYGIPWNRAAHSANRPQNGNFVLLDKISFRNVEIRDAD